MKAVFLLNKYTKSHQIITISDELCWEFDGIKKFITTVMGHEVISYAKFDDCDEEKFLGQTASYLGKIMKFIFIYKIDDVISYNIFYIESGEPNYIAYKNITIEAMEYFLNIWQKKYFDNDGISKILKIKENYKKWINEAVIWDIVK